MSISCLSAVSQLSLSTLYQSLSSFSVLSQLSLSSLSALTQGRYFIILRACLVQTVGAQNTSSRLMENFQMLVTQIMHIHRLSLQKKLSCQYCEKVSPVPHYLARVLFAELDSVCKDRLEEVLLLASGPLLLLLLVLLFLPLPHDVLDMFPLLVPLLKRHGPSLLLLELPLITGYELPKARVQAGTVGERLQTTGGVLVLDHRGRGS